MSSQSQQSADEIYSKEELVCITSRREWCLFLQGVKYKRPASITNAREKASSLIRLSYIKPGITAFLDPTFSFPNRSMYHLFPLKAYEIFVSTSFLINLGAIYSRQHSGNLVQHKDPGRYTRPSTNNPETDPFYPFAEVVRV